MRHQHRGIARFWATRLKCFGEFILLNIKRKKSRKLHKNILETLTSKNFVIRSMLWRGPILLRQRGFKELVVMFCLWTALKSTVVEFVRRVTPNPCEMYNNTPLFCIAMLLQKHALLLVVVHIHNLHDTPHPCVSRCFFFAEVSLSGVVGTLPKFLGSGPGELLGLRTASAPYRSQNPQNREKRVSGSSNFNFPPPQKRAF